MKQTKKILASSLGVLALAGLALADDTTSGYSGLENMEQPKVEEAKNVFQINPGYTYLGEADYDHDNLGNISVWRFDIPIHYTIKTEPGDLRLGVFYEYSEYDFDNLAGGAGAQQFNTLAFDVLWKGMINDEWGYFLYGNVGMSAVTDVTLSDGLTGTGGGGVRYVWSDNLSLGLGGAVATQMEENPKFLPIIALNWQINDRWNLRTLNGATLTFDVTGDKKFLLDVGGKYQRRDTASGTTTRSSIRCSAASSVPPTTSPATSACAGASASPPAARWRSAKATTRWAMRTSMPRRPSACAPSSRSKAF